MNPIARRSLPGLALAALAGTARADDWRPARPIRLILPLATGGSLDTVARGIGLQISPELGQPVVVEARPGAGGNIAFEAVAHAAPDGTVLLIGWDSLLINPSLFGRIGYDPLRDFAPITQTVAAPQVLVVRTESPFRDLAGFLAASRGAGVSFASPGNGSIGHLTGEAFKLMATAGGSGGEMSHVPYRGAAPAATDLLAGHVESLWVTLPAIAEHVKSGRMRGLMLADAQRIAVFPEIPSAAELGFPDLVAISWQGLLAPAGTPPEIVSRLQTLVAGALADPVLRGRLESTGFTAVGSTPAAMAAMLAREFPRWAGVVRRSGAKAD
ncbi:MAG: tripartite tricarboxylate transporter substrate binding protein [Rubritepida sp.]|nr:tripartite tricarboxylate transporter substrate binding protein [Rubritepida sp.]